MQEIEHIRNRRITRNTKIKKKNGKVQPLTQLNIFTFQARTLLALPIGSHRSDERESKPVPLLGSMPLCL